MGGHSRRVPSNGACRSFGRPDGFAQTVWCRGERCTRTSACRLEPRTGTDDSTPPRVVGPARHRPETAWTRTPMSTATRSGAWETRSEVVQRQRRLRSASAAPCRPHANRIEAADTAERRAWPHRNAPPPHCRGETGRLAVPTTTGGRQARVRAY